MANPTGTLKYNEESSTLQYQNNSDFEKYRRKVVELKDEPIEFQYVDILEKFSKVNDCDEQPFQMATLLGITRDGYTIAVRVLGMDPYFYVKCRKGMEPNCLGFRNYCESLLIKLEKGINMTQPILNVEVLKKKTVYKYQSEISDFYKITLASSFIKKILFNEFKKLHEQTFEGRIKFTTQFVTTTGLQPCKWIKLNKFGFVQQNRCISTCQIELFVYWNETNCDIEIMEDDISSINLRYMSWDIECLPGPEGQMPKPETEPIIQIGIILQDENLKQEKIIMTAGLCEPIEGITVLCYKSERQLLYDFRKLFVIFTPDVLISYNGDAFDTPYVFKRAQTLNMITFPFFSRIRNHLSKAEKFSFVSNAFNETFREDVYIPGVVSLDMMEVIKREHNLQSYKLNSVSNVFLNNRKVDLKISLLRDLQNGGPKKRKLIAEYCVQDALLPFKLAEYFKTITNKWMFSRISGCVLRDVLIRGQSIKLETLLFSYLQREAEYYLIPDYVPKDNGKYQGAYVVDVIEGYHYAYTGVLDFKAMYPSILIKYNICLTTFLRPTDLQNFDPSEYNKSPDGHYFLKEPKGILPPIAQMLLNNREDAKRKMQNSTGVERDNWNSFQLTCKILANSLYGYTGASTSKLCLKGIASSVTSYGRGMTLLVKDLGNKYGQVIAGDTDSVFIKLNVDTYDKALEICNKLQDEVNARLVKPSEIELEKIMRILIIFGKKRYAGIIETEKGPKQLIKGIEVVRRDAPPFVKSVMKEILEMALNYENHEKDFVKPVDMSDEELKKLSLHEFQKLAAKQACVKTIDIVRKKMFDLNMSKLSISEFIVSKTLKSKYEVPQPHHSLHLRMEKKCPGSGFAVGSRVQYIIVERESGSKIHEQSELPLKVLTNEEKISKKYYRGYFIKSVLRLMLPILQDFIDIKDVKDTKLKEKKLYEFLFNNPKCRFHKDKGKPKPFEEEVQQKIYPKFSYKTRGGGDDDDDDDDENIQEEDEDEQSDNYTFQTFSSTKEEPQSSNALKNLLKFQDRCDNCNGVLVGKNNILCTTCIKENFKPSIENECKRELIEKLNFKEKAQDICLKCQPEKYLRTSCSNQECDILYKRSEVLTEIEDLKVKLKKLSLIKSKDEGQVKIHKRKFIEEKDIPPRKQIKTSQSLLISLFKKQ